MSGVATVESPLGLLVIRTNGRAVVSIGFDARVPPAPPDTIATRARDQLAEWLAGERKTFDFPLDPGGTPFQAAVWRHLLSIPFGETRSYADIAVAIGKPSAVRAVGAANGANPIAIAIPCHRVIAKDGSLQGYAGGLERKQWLLEWEKR